MPKFSLVELPPELRLQRSPIVRVERDAIYIGLRVFSEKDPTDIADLTSLGEGNRTTVGRRSGGRDP
jgi:hypothetical protein